MDKKTQQKKNQKAKRPSTQTYTPIAEIKDGVVVLKDGTMRSVMMASSINFALKSEDEQNALISAYVGFLNSLDFPIQIVVQSRKLQIQSYLEKLIAIEKEQQNELLRVQIADYRMYIQELVDIGQIMTKKFYVVVPYDPLGTHSQKGFFKRFKEIMTPASSIRMKEEQFKKKKESLSMRVRQVSGGLQSIGLQIAELNTQALIELFYTTYNPDTSFAETLAKTEDIKLE
jgi:hypothetical protein